MATRENDVSSRRRGFAAMDRELQRSIASRGGRAAHQRGTAHEWNSQEAAEAGRRGGRAAHERGTAHEWTSKEAAEAGRRGGRASRDDARKQEAAPEQEGVAEPQSKGMQTKISKTRVRSGDRDRSGDRALRSHDGARRRAGRAGSHGDTEHTAAEETRGDAYEGGDADAGAEAEDAEEEDEEGFSEQLRGRHSIGFDDREAQPGQVRSDLAREDGPTLEES